MKAPPVPINLRWIQVDTLVISEHMSGYTVVRSEPYLGAAGVWKVATTPHGTQPCVDLVRAELRHIQAYRLIGDSLDIPDQELGALVKTLLGEN